LEELSLRDSTRKTVITKAIEANTHASELWKAGKTLETIARATDRYQTDADDPLRSFRVTLTALERLLQRALTLGVSREMLEH
jgi:hypothetical protein